VVNPEVISVWWNALDEYEFAYVREAFAIHIKKGEFAPRPAHILAILDVLQPDGRPSADEAWAMIPKDEAKSVVWTDEMAEAMGIAQPLINQGDNIAARMAFKSAYERIVESNRASGIKPKWLASLGQDKAGRDPVLEEAVRLGRLDAEHVKTLVVSAGTLIELEMKPNRSPEARRSLAIIKNMINEKSVKKQGNSREAESDNHPLEDEIR
jgi:hypothetical protein